MQIATGTAVDGKVVIEGVRLTEGALVAVVARGADDGFTLTREEEDELLAAMAEIERGEFVTLDDLLQSLPAPPEMPLRIKIAARAANQIRRAATWWATNRLSARDAVAIDLRESLALPAEHLGIGALYVGGRTPGVRRLFLGRLGYFVYYEVGDGDLRVLACWHTSRERQPDL